MSIKCSMGIHTWVGCKCSGCGKTRDEQHQWNECVCTGCGKKKQGAVHSFANGVCTRCGTEQTNGIYTDPRDNRQYKVIKLGGRWWFAENLAFKPDSGNFWAYNNDVSNVRKYGYLYDWETANKVSPPGWHLPSEEEWISLVSGLVDAVPVLDPVRQRLLDQILDVTRSSYFGAGARMKTAFDWQKPNEDANNESGFTALPAGVYFSGNEPPFCDLHKTTLFWSGTPQGDDNAWCRSLTYEYTSAQHVTVERTAGCSVRCVMD